MKKTYKIEFKPNKTQIQVINKTLGTCRYLYNKYLYANKRFYEEYNVFVTGYDFDKLVNKLSKGYNSLSWIKDCSSKARKQSIMDGELAFKKFFKGISKYPRFKRKNDIQSYYFIKDQVQITNRRIKVPILGWLKLKEYGYIPKDSDVVSGRIVKTKTNRYYIILIVNYEPKKYKKVKNFGLGIDAGIKDYLIITNGQKIFKFKNINKTYKIKNIEYKIKQYQKIIANKIEINKKKYIKEGGTAIYSTKNIKRIQLKMNKLYEKLSFIRNDYIKKICSFLVKTKPRYITIENLSNQQILINGNHNLAEKWAKCEFGYFKDFLIWKCKNKGIELRIANKFYPSSKICCKCGYVKRDLTLKDRTYKCPKCGLTIDRDINAAINLFKLEDYNLAY